MTLRELEICKIVLRAKRGEISALGAAREITQLEQQLRKTGKLPQAAFIRQ